MYKKIIDLIQKNLSLLLLSPIILNFFMKLILGEVVLLNYYQQNKIVILILITNSIFFTYLSYQINSSLKLILYSERAAVAATILKVDPGSN